MGRNAIKICTVIVSVALLGMTGCGAKQEEVSVAQDTLAQTGTALNEQTSEGVSTGISKDETQTIGQDADVNEQDAIERNEQVGTAGNATEQSGAAQVGTALDGTEQDGTALNGTEQNGSAQNSTAGNATEQSEANQEVTHLNIQIGNTTLTVALADNSSTEALKEYLAEGPVTIAMEDYAGMEKVGDLGTSLPQNNEQMHTSAGDVILYQGRNFVIYYGTNSWSLTPIGKVENVTPEELKEILGDGGVEVTLSL